MQDILNAVRYAPHTKAAAAITTYTGDINAHNGFWCGSFLTVAVMFDNIPAIEALAGRRDVDLQAQTAGKECDLVHFAVGRNKPATLRALLRGFPKITLNACVSCSHPRLRDRTPLVKAAFCGYVELVQLLLDAGADPVLGAPQNEARVSGHKAIATQIEQHIASANSLRHVWTRAVVNASSFF